MQIDGCDTGFRDLEAKYSLLRRTVDSRQLPQGRCPRSVGARLWTQFLPICSIAHRGNPGFLLSQIHREITVCHQQIEFGRLANQSSHNNSVFSRWQIIHNLKTTCCIGATEAACGPV